MKKLSSLFLGLFLLLPPKGQSQDGYLIPGARFDGQNKPITQSVNITGTSANGSPIVVPIVSGSFAFSGTNVTTGNVGGYTVQISPTVTILSGSNYLAGYSIGGKLTFSGAMRTTGGSGLIQSVQLIENSTPATKAALELILFDTPTLTGTYTNQTAITLHASDIPHIIRRISISASDYVTVSGTTVSIADISPGSRVIVASGTNALGGLLIVPPTATGTASWSASNSLILRAGFLQD